MTLGKRFRRWLLGLKPTRLRVGARVRARRDPTFPGPWPSEPLRTIVPWPTSQQDLFRIIDHKWGLQRSFFVLFDEPQFDTDGPDGGGPYYKAEVWERYLEVASAPSPAHVSLRDPD